MFEYSRDIAQNPAQLLRCLGAGYMESPDIGMTINEAINEAIKHKRLLHSGFTIDRIHNQTVIA